jgi:NhaP-type Na+/H+ or K+/H+ antiporter
VAVASLAAIGLAILGYAAISRRAERSPLTPPIYFVGVGLALGAAGADILVLPMDGAVIHGLAELTLVLVLFTDASRIDLDCLRREESLPVRLLALGLPLCVLLGALAGHVVLPGVGLLETLLLAAILAPTDAALGQAVVSNTRVPVRIRQTLNVESGLNDGIALPLVLVLASLAGAREEGGGVGY